MIGRLSRMADRGDKTDELAGLIEVLGAVLRSGKEASEAVPWFDDGRWEGLRMLDNGRIGLGLVGRKSGIALESLFGLHAERELPSGRPTAFWSLHLSGDFGKDCQAYCDNFCCRTFHFDCGDSAQQSFCQLYRERENLQGVPLA